jgi:hypothetical protein
MGEIPQAPGTYRTGASASSSQDVFSPQQSTTETRKRQADTEAHITARSGELRQIGTQETELGQFTPSLLNALSIEQAVKIRGESRRKNYGLCHHCEEALGGTQSAHPIDTAQEAVREPEEAVEVTSCRRESTRRRGRR